MARFTSDGRLEDDLLTRRNHLARKPAPSESRNAFAFEAILYGTSVALLRVASMTLGNGENAFSRLSKRPRGKRNLSYSIPFYCVRRRIGHRQTCN